MSSDQRVGSGMIQSAPRRIRTIAAAAALALAALALAFPPMHDAAVSQGEPVFAWVLRPPPGVNISIGQTLEIMWPVLLCEWAIVALLLAAVWGLTATASRFSRLQRAIALAGTVAAIGQLLFPPWDEWGTMFSHGWHRSCLFVRQPPADTRYLDVQRLVLGLALTAAAVLVLAWLAGRVERRRA